MLSETERCPTCGGEGDVPALIETPAGPVACPYIGEPCPDCGGTGKRALLTKESDDAESLRAISRDVMDRTTNIRRRLGDDDAE